MSENQSSPRNLSSNLIDMTDWEQTAPVCDWCKEKKLACWWNDPFLELLFNVEQAKYFCEDCWDEREREALDALAES